MAKFQAKRIEPDIKVNCQLFNLFCFINSKMNAMIKIFFVLIILSMIGFTSVGYKQGYVPKDGFVPDEETAVKIAEAILIPVFGKDQIHSEKPFHAALSEGGTVWVISGTLYHQKGGVAEIKIQKSDCKVIEMFHGK